MDLCGLYEEDVQVAVKQVLLGLAFLHEEIGIVHRGISSSLLWTSKLIKAAADIKANNLAFRLTDKKAAFNDPLVEFPAQQCDYRQYKREAWQEDIFMARSRPIDDYFSTDRIVVILDFGQGTF